MSSSVISKIILYLLLSFILMTDSSARTSKPATAVQEYLKNELSSYDLIDYKGIISKRSIGMETKQAQFVAFNRTFNLILTPIISEAIDFNITMVATGIGKDSDYSASIMNDFYTGHVEDDPASRVKGYFTGNQFLCSIYFGSGEILNIEPLSRISGDLSETKLLAYYDSQMTERFNLSSIACGTNDTSMTKMENVQVSKTISAGTTHSRPTRSAADSDRVTCSLQAVADHAFFNRVGLAQIGATMRTIVKIIDDVNEVFFATKLPDPKYKSRAMPRVGFKLSSVHVLTKPDQTPSDSFNAPIDPKKTYSASALLKAFYRVDEMRINLSSYCLNHLFTYRPMQRNVLGLARVATPCSYSNIGLTSHCQTGGFPLLFRQAVLVTAHELGHNMGSTHDPEGNLQCMPEASDGGAYLMHAKSVLGFDKNNDKFSPCSIKAIAEIVKPNLERCLKKETSSLCGNHRRDPGEQCDSGLAGDACCHSNCSLKSGADCSDANSPCCNKCKVAPKGAVCLPESPLRPCRQPSRCNGSSFDCPSPPPPAADGAVCNSGVGRCHAGACQSACYPDAECACPEPQHACLLCCQRQGAGKKCLPFESNGRPLALPIDWPCHSNSRNGPGRRCLANGTCSTSMLAGMIDSSVHSGAGEVADSPNGKAGSRLMDLRVAYRGGSFASNNIVFITLIVSLIIYVPICLLFNYRNKPAVEADEENAPDGDITFDVTHDAA